MEAWALEEGVLFKVNTDTAFPASPAVLPPLALPPVPAVSCCVKLIAPVVDPPMTLTAEASPPLPANPPAPDADPPAPDVALPLTETLPPADETAITGPSVAMPPF